MVLDDLSERAEALSATSDNPELNTDDTSSTIIEPFIEATSTLTHKTNQLSQSLAPTLDSLEPLELNREVSFDEQISQIEDYLKQLSKRLDRLEEAMTRIEEQFAQLQPPSVQITESKVFDKEDAINLSYSDDNVLNVIDTLANEDPQTFLPNTELANDPSRYVTSLWGYAQTLQALGEDSEIPLSDNKTLWVEKQNTSTRLLVSDANLNDIWFEAEQLDDERWQVHYNELSEADQQAILNLPQSPAQYAQLATAQEMVETFQQQVALGDRPISFAWTDSNGNPKYEFKLTEPRSDSSRLLTGYEVGSNYQALTATLTANKPPQIHQCDISRDEMESLLQDLAPEPEQVTQETRLQEPTQRSQKQRQLKRPRLPEL